MRQLWCTTVLMAGLGISVITAIVPPFAHACAVCGGAEENGYFWGVLFLMSMPFAIGSLVGGWLWCSYRRTRLGRAASSPPLATEGGTPGPASTALQSATLGLGRKGGRG